MKVSLRAFAPDGREIKENDSISSYAGKNIVMMTNNSIQHWFDSQKGIIERLILYAKIILKNVTDFSNLTENIKQSGFYAHNCSINNSCKTYKVSEAKKILQLYNSNIGDLSLSQMQELGSFLNSFVHYEAKVFEFSVDETSLEFLFDNKEKGGTRERGGGSTYTSLEQIKNTKLTTNAKTGLVNATANAFYELGVKFQKVIINSGYRTHGWQADYMVKNPNSWQKYDITRKLMSFCLDIYNGVLTQEYIQKVRDKTIEDKKLLNRINDLHKSTELFSKGYIQRITPSNQTVLIDVLEDIFIADIYSPSPHPDSHTVDLQANSSGQWIYDNASCVKKYPENGFRHIQFR